MEQHLPSNNELTGRELLIQQSMRSAAVDIGAEGAENAIPVRVLPTNVSEPIEPSTSGVGKGKVVESTLKTSQKGGGKNNQKADNDSVTAKPPLKEIELNWVFLLLKMSSIVTVIQKLIRAQFLIQQAAVMMFRVYQTTIMIRMSLRTGANRARRKGTAIWGWHLSNYK